MVYLRQALPEKHQVSCSEHQPLSRLHRSHVAMFQEEFHEWSERHDHNLPSLSAILIDRGAESGAQVDRRS